MLSALSVVLVACLASRQSEEERGFSRVDPARKVDRYRSRFTPEVRHGLTKFALMYTYAHQTSASFTRCPCPRYFFPHRLQYSSSILRWYASAVGRHLFRR